MIRTRTTCMVFAASLLAFVMGAVMSDLQAGQAATTASDVEFRWTESSGPHGERNPAALPLYEAIFANEPQKVATLVEHGASPNLVLYPRRWSPLMLAIAFYDSEIVRLLVKRGANLNYVTDNPTTGTPLALALSYGRFHTIEHPDFAIFRYLLDSGADMNVEFGIDHSDIAIYAATMGQMAIVDDLLARGYRHNLPKLKEYLEIRRVDAEMQPEKERAIATVDRLLRNGQEDRGRSKN